jgi:hypothetical protein
MTMGAGAGTDVQCMNKPCLLESSKQDASRPGAADVDAV